VFGFDGIIFGSVDAPYLHQEPADMVDEAFVDRRGAAAFLFLGGKLRVGWVGEAKSRPPKSAGRRCGEQKNTYSSWREVELRGGARDSLTRVSRRSQQERRPLEEEAALHPQVPGSGDPKRGAGVVLGNIQ